MWVHFRLLKYQHGANRGEADRRRFKMATFLWPLLWMQTADITEDTFVDTSLCICDRLLAVSDLKSCRLTKSSNQLANMREYLKCFSLFISLCGWTSIANAPSWVTDTPWLHTRYRLHVGAIQSYSCDCDVNVLNSAPNWNCLSQPRNVKLTMQTVSLTLPGPTGYTSIICSAEILATVVWNAAGWTEESWYVPVQKVQSPALANNYLQEARMICSCGNDLLKWNTQPS